jgi:DNA-binding NarL/FixJ family response regulator
MERPSIRIFVVEDFSPFREFICATLRKDPGIDILVELFDGPEAVQQAEELKPDLILPDIGLPTMNGIEVARTIRKIAPESKIIFVTQVSDAEVVQDALDREAAGNLSALNCCCRHRPCNRLPLQVIVAKSLFE